MPASIDALFGVDGSARLSSNHDYAIEDRAR
jgi:hypothetical protein